MYQQATLGAFHKDDQRDNADGDDDDHENERRRQRTGAAEFQRAGKRLGQACGNTGKDDQRNTVADTTRGDLFAKPHQEHRAAEQRDDGGDAEEPARIDHKAGTAFKADRDTIGLQRAEQHRTVAGVLVDDLAAGFAFLLQRFERGHDRGHELHDDRSGDVRHDTEGEDRHALDSATRKHVEKTKNTVGLALKGLRIGFGVQARKRNMGAKTVDEKCGKSKPETLFQILRLSEGRKIQVRSQLFRCGRHKFLRMTLAGQQNRPMRKGLKDTGSKTGLRTNTALRRHHASPCFFMSYPLPYGSSRTVRLSLQHFMPQAARITAAPRRVCHGASLNRFRSKAP